MINVPRVFLRSVLEEVYEEIKKAYRPDCCIAGTWMVREVLDRFGVPSKPLTCRCLVFNQKQFDWMLKNGRMMREDEKPLMDEIGGWVVGVGYGDPQPGKWPGHLVAVAAGRYLLDVSITQASRPAKNINLTPTYGQIEPDFLSGEPADPVKVGDSYILYDPDPDDRSYEASPDWVHGFTRHLSRVEAVYRRLRDRNFRKGGRRGGGGC